MNTLKLWAKALTQLGGSLLIAVLPLLSTGRDLSTSEWVNVAITGVGAAVVWNTQNHPEWPYGKLIGSALIAALTVFNSALSDGITQPEVIQIILAFVTSVTVAVVPNSNGELKNPQSMMNPEGTTQS